MLTINRDVLKIAHALRELQATTGLEHLHAVAADGAVYVASGQADHVTAPHDLEARYEEPGADVVYHHSHPDDRALSPSDLALIARPGVATIWAHSPSGASYGATLRHGTANERYREALDLLHGYLLLELVQYGGAALDARSFEAFRDFAVMLALEAQGWIDCHMVWSDRTRRSILQPRSGFRELVHYLTSVTTTP